MHWSRPARLPVLTAWAVFLAVLIYLGAPQGRRVSLPNARFLLHQPSTATRGQASDIDIAAREIIFLKRQLLEILAKHTGQTVDKLHEDTDRDFFLRPQTAAEYGLIDQIVTRKT